MLPPNARAAPRLLPCRGDTSRRNVGPVVGHHSEVRRPDSRADARGELELRRRYSKVTAMEHANHRLGKISAAEDCAPLAFMAEGTLHAQEVTVSLAFRS